MFVSIRQHSYVLVNLTLTMGMMGTSEFTAALRPLITLGQANKPQFLHLYFTDLKWGLKCDHMYIAWPLCRRTSTNANSLSPCEKIPGTSSPRWLIKEKITVILCPNYKAVGSWNALQDAVSLDSWIHLFKQLAVDHLSPLANLIEVT